MASASDSTRAPSRRAFLGHAVASGVAAAQPPIFVVPVLADAALLALGSGALALIERSERLERDYVAGGELICEMTGAIPTRPKRAAYAQASEHLAAMVRYENDKRRHDERVAQVEERIGYAAMEEACNASFGEVVEIRERLAGMQATTLEGLIAKARVADRSVWDGLSKSIVADLIAMG